VKERLRQLKIEAAKERLQDALSPLDEGARQLRAAVYAAAAAIRESLQKHQYLPGASAKRARELARWYRLMNWQSDRQLEALVAERPGMPVAWTPELEDAVQFLSRRARPGDLVLTIGAGDVERAGPLLLEALA